MPEGDRRSPSPERGRGVASGASADLAASRGEYLCARLLLVLGEQDIRVRLIDQGSSKITAVFVVHSENFKRAVNAIYQVLP